MRSPKGFRIVINESDHSLITSRRFRWSIAHEIGHYVLKHPKPRTDEEALIYDDEAETFAKYLLIPYPALRLHNIRSSEELRKLCDISFEASQIGYTSYLQWLDTAHYKKSDCIYYENIRELFSKFIVCNKCKTITPTISRGNHCHICGSKKFSYAINVPEEIMIYDEIMLNNKFKTSVCPICENEETHIDGNFCQICGTYIKNRCSALSDEFNGYGIEDCPGYEGLPGNARYCPHCGAPSTFLLNKLLSPWNEQPRPLTEEEIHKLLDGDNDMPF